MNLLAGPAWAALALLVIAGAPKVVKPYDLMRALRLAGLRVPHVVVRVFGAVEALIGVVGLLTGNRLLLALAALSYLGFAGFVGYALTRKTPLSSCGCFGKADTPPTRLHVVVVATFALLLGVTAVGSGPAGLIPMLGSEPGVALATLGYAALICWFAYLALAVLPTTYATPTVPTRTDGHRRPIRLSAAEGPTS